MLAAIVTVVLLMGLIAGFVAIRPKDLFKPETATDLAVRASESPFELRRTLLLIGPTVNYAGCSEQRRMLKPVLDRLLAAGHRLVEVYGEKPPSQNGVRLDWLDNPLLRSTFDAETGFPLLYIDNDGRVKFRVAAPVTGEALLMIIDPVNGRPALPPADPAASAAVVPVTSPDQHPAPPPDLPERSVIQDLPAAWDAMRPVAAVNGLQSRVRPYRSAFSPSCTGADTADASTPVNGHRPAEDPPRPTNPFAARLDSLAAHLQPESIAPAKEVRAAKQDRADTPSGRLVFKSIQILGE